MQYKQLGTSSLQVSRIAFGCMSLNPHDIESEKIIRRAVDLGINYFDTADLYDKGDNEVMLGKALKNIRDKVIIATKAGNQWKADGSGWEWNPNKDYILKCANQSLKRLQTDYIDLFQLHGGTINDPIDETISAFEQLLKEGKIRHYGISSIRPNVIREWVQRSNIVSVMMQYSLLDRRPEEEILSLLQQHNIGVLTRGSLAQGLLVNKPSRPYLDYTADHVARAARAIGEYSKERTTSQTALQFVLMHKSVTAAVPGIRTMKQMEDVAGTIHAISISDKKYLMLKSAIPINKYMDHR